MPKNLLKIKKFLEAQQLQIEEELMQSFDPVVEDLVYTDKYFFITRETRESLECIDRIIQQESKDSQENLISESKTSPCKIKDLTGSSKSFLLNYNHRYNTHPSEYLSSLRYTFDAEDNLNVNLNPHARKDILKASYGLGDPVAPLYVAMAMHYSELIRELIDKGADINIDYEYCVTGCGSPIHKAFSIYKQDSQKFPGYFFISNILHLVETGVDVNRIVLTSLGNGDRNFSALQFAVRIYNDPFLTELLIDLGADIDVIEKQIIQQDDNGEEINEIKYNSILHLSKENINGPSYQTVKFLLANGARIDATNSEDGETPRDIAPHFGFNREAERCMNEVLQAAENFFNIIKEEKFDLQAAKSTLNIGASINQRNQAGQTPLHVACLHNRIAACEFLLSQSPNINALDDLGNRPFDLMHEDFFIELFSTLKNQHVLEIKNNYQILYNRAALMLRRVGFFPLSDEGKANWQTVVGQLGPHMMHLLFQPFNKNVGIFDEHVAGRATESKKIQESAENKDPVNIASYVGKKC